MRGNTLPDNPFIEAITGALNHAGNHSPDLSTRLVSRGWSEHGEEELPSWFAVTDLAAASIGAANAELASYIDAASVSGSDPTDTYRVEVDRRLASLWFGWSIAPQGWEMPAAWDALAGDYPCSNGWIKLHTNAPHHRSAALRALEIADSKELDRKAVARRVSQWDNETLETAVIAAGGCAAAMRDIDSWLHHPQGQALQKEPLILWKQRPAADSASDPTPADAPIDSNRPLRGIKVLDLTRVLAGPVASRFLARCGADVLRIDPPDWEEPGVIPEVTLGKRCAGLNLKDASDRAQFEALLASADILLHGYRPGALNALGYGLEQRQALNPRLIDVSLCAYGFSGPWANRRGFDSLVQMSCGIAAWGMQHAESATPSPLPVQALDHATGYLVAAATMRALRARRFHNQLFSAQLSLAQTGLLLSTTKGNQLLRANRQEISAATAADYSDWVEETSWGEARRLRYPASISGTQMAQMKWSRPAQQLRTSKAQWLNAQSGS